MNLGHAAAWVSQSAELPGGALNLLQSTAYTKIYQKSKVAEENAAV